MSSDDTDVPHPPPSLVPPAGESLAPPEPSTIAIPPSPPSSVHRVALSMPPMPAVAPLLDRAVEARERGDFEGALEAYKKALFVTPEEDPIAQASIYASIAEVKLAQGKPREAETNFEKALAAKPKHLRSIEGLVQLATEAREWERSVAFRQKRVEALDDPEEKAAELCRIADILESQLAQPEKAADALERAGMWNPGDLGVLLKLRHLYVTLRAWPKLMGVLDELVDISSDPRHRGAYRFAQADIVLGRLREEPRGLAFLEMALDEDPQHDRALSALVAVRTRREEWTELTYVYERLIDRFAGLGDRERAWEVCRKLATLRRDRLLDGPGALEAFQGAVDLRPDDAESRASLAELHAAKGDRKIAVRELELAAESAPFRAQTYRRLFDLHQRSQRTDRAWLVATCLAELGAAEVQHDLVIEQFRPDGPIRPTTALDSRWWDELLAAPGSDTIVSGIVRTVGEMAIALRLEELAAKKKLPVLDPKAKPEKNTTASVVRTFTWASRALGIPAPELYLLEDVPSGIAAVPAAAPGTALGPQVRSGKSVQELAFLAGRHLTYYRPEHYALVFFPTLAELSSLVLAAMRVVIPGLPVPPSPDPDSKVGELLASKVSAPQKAQLERIVSKLDARGGRLDLLAWIRGVELTAARAGLLLAGDLRTAMRILKEEKRTIGELSLETKRGDLLAYCASDRYGELRERMGVAIHSIAGET